MEIKGWIIKGIYHEYFALGKCSLDSYTEEQSRPGGFVCKRLLTNLLTVSHVWNVYL